MTASARPDAPGGLVDQHRRRDQQGVAVCRYAPGEEMAPAQFDPGDFILVHRSGFFAWLIRFGQGLRYWGKDRKYTRWSHAAMIVSSDGDLIEALDRGVVRTHISDYKETEYHLVHLTEALSDERDREQEVAFAQWSADCHQRYGWITILSLSLNLLTGCKFTFGIDGESICSGLVAKCLERTGVILEGNTANTSPADLAKHFAVEPPPAGTSKGAMPPQVRASAAQRAP